MLGSTMFSLTGRIGYTKASEWGMRDSPKTTHARMNRAWARHMTHRERPTCFRARNIVGRHDRFYRAGDASYRRAVLVSTGEGAMMGWSTKSTCKAWWEINTWKWGSGKINTWKWGSGKIYKMKMRLRCESEAETWKWGLTMKMRLLDKYMTKMRLHKYINEAERLRIDEQWLEVNKHHVY